MKEDEIENIKEEEELKADLQFNFSQFFSSLKNYLNSTIDIRSEVDYEGSVEDIKKDIDFKGANVWVLGASIVIASIGLNVNSTAVIIGAMLISPLMGPIVGMGLAIGINNFKMLIRSLKSLGTAVLISLLVSTIYFWITPFGDVQPELIARTKPNLLDVMVAFFAGIALIVAKTKKGTVASVILGVAIATALMPPLCVAGYGLANSNWDFFFGAFYLFLINSVFIALSTLLIIKYLRFPLATYTNLARQKKVKRYILISSILIVLPSGYIFWKTIDESLFNNKVNEFISENFDYESTWISNKKIKYAYGGVCSVDIFLSGEIIPPQIEENLMKKFDEYNMEDAILKIHQHNKNEEIEEMAGKVSADLKVGILGELFEKSEGLVQNKDKQIAFLQDELIRIKQDTIPFSAIKGEIRVQYKEVVSMSYGKTISTDFGSQQDTNLTFFIKWDEQLEPEDMVAKQQSMQDWLRIRLNDKKLNVLNY